VVVEGIRHAVAEEEGKLHPRGFLLDAEIVHLASHSKGWVSILALLLLWMLLLASRRS
jgi:hypothetical protein